jgi:predicted nucleotidyltransferase
MKLKEKYTVNYIEENNLCILKVLVGSYSQNLQTEKSDKDYAGVFVLEMNDYYSLQNKIEQFDTVISNDPDITYMELGKFIELLSKNNPNALEILASSYIEENVVFKHDIFKIFNLDEILSKKCQYTFGKYASDQVKKATGLNKKMNNPIPMKKKSPLDFCQFYDDKINIKLSSYFKKENIDQKFIGLQGIKNSKSTYRVYLDAHSELCFSEYEDIIKYRNGFDDLSKYKKSRKFAKFKGVIHPNETSNALRLSSIPKDWSNHEPYNIRFLGYIYYNLEGYETYCKDYREYQDWIKKRNPERHKHNIGQQFDVKNMSHCCRLLTMAKEIAETGEINVRRTDDADFFRDIKIGKINYKEVMDYSLEHSKNLELYYKNSKLPDEPNFTYLNNLSYITRKVFYGR